MKTDNLKRKVWFIARAFPPIEAIGADRASKWARSLSSQDLQVVVFTVEANIEKISDLASEAELRKNVGASKIIRTPMLFADEFFGRGGAPVRKKIMRAIYGIITMFFLGDSGWIWSSRLKRRLDAELPHGLPLAIIATGSPFFTFTTIRRFARTHNIPYILDYRDLWSENPHLRGIPYISRIITKFIENRVNRDASLITTVSKGCAEILSKYNTTLTLYNVPDGYYINNIQKIKPNTLCSKHITLYFGGTLYEERNLEPFALALASLPSNISDRFRLIYCGSSSSYAQKNFQDHGVQNLLIDLGMLRKEDSLKMLKSSSICISVVHVSQYKNNPAVHGIMTTKIFDYLIAGKQVINIAPKNSELVDWLREHEFTNVVTFDGTELHKLSSHLEQLACGDLSQCHDLTPLQTNNLQTWEDQFEVIFRPQLLNILGDFKPV